MLHGDDFGPTRSVPGARWCGRAVRHARRATRLAFCGLIAGSFLAFSLAALAQDPSQRQAVEKANDVLQRARTLYAEQGPREAMPVYERALALFRQEGDRRGEAITLGYIGNCYKKFGEFEKALDYLQRALALKREVKDRAEEGRTLSNLGLLFNEMGDYPRAAEYQSQALALGRELKDSQLEAAALNNLALVYDATGDYQRSLAQYQLAVELHRANGYGPGESDALGNIGGWHQLLGHYAECISYYNQALAISERLRLKASASKDLGNLALCHVGLGRIDEAVALYQRAAALAADTGDKRDEADWHKGLGGALVARGRYSAAFVEYARALEIYQAAGFKEQEIEALSDRGSLHVTVGDLGAGESDLRQALTLARAIKDPREVSQALMALGDLERRRARWQASEALFEEALRWAADAKDVATRAACSSQLVRIDIQRGRNAEAVTRARQTLAWAREAAAPPLVAEALWAVGEALRAMGDGEASVYAQQAEDAARQLGSPELLWRAAFLRGHALEASGKDEDAIAAYRRSIATIEGIRGQLVEDRFRAGYVEDKYGVYVALVRLLLKIGRTDQAFETAEKLRARGYLDLLNRQQAPIADAAQRAKEAGLRARIARLQRRLDDERAAPSEGSRQAVELFTSELNDAEREYSRLLDDLTRTDPAYVEARTLAVPSAERVKQTVPSRTALVEYLVSDDSTSIFVVAGGNVRAVVVPVRAADVRARVELLRDLIQRDTSDEWRGPAEGLWQVLIGPAESQGWLRDTDRLFIVPHGILHYVPFAALWHRSGAARRLLVQDYELAYLPSASALSVSSAAERSEPTLFALATARSGLRYTAVEARSIGATFGAKSVVFTGAAATESAFKRRAPDFRVLHLATHGSFNKINPLFSAIELEPGGQDDGRLEVHEILGMRLAADLVTLSACDTALGSGYLAEYPAGSDIVGLTRAFLFAGSKSVVASLWQVNDRSTSTLMRSFYARLSRSAKASALARAQRAMVAGGGPHAHPFYWAAFVLVGEAN